jgi:hypothetical protein
MSTHTKQIKTISIIRDDQNEVKGSKGYFPDTSTVARQLEEVDIDTLAANIHRFSDGVTSALRSEHNSSSNFLVEALEFTLVIAAKGEIRLVAGVSGEITGGIKIVVKRKS